MSSDGRYVLFTSRANWISSEDDNAFSNVFVRDTVADTTTLVSRATGAAGAAANGDSFAGGISADGTKAVFISAGANLMPGHVTQAEVFVRNLATNQTIQVSPLNSNAASSEIFTGSTRDRISANGTKVAFQTIGAIDPQDSGFAEDTYVANADGTGTPVWVNRSGAGAAGDGTSLASGISADGSMVAFESTSTNLVTGDTNGSPDVFVRDLGSNATILVSRASGPTGTIGDSESRGGGISADGTRVAFSSFSSNLSPGNAGQIYVRDLGSNETILVSRDDGASGTETAGNPQLQPAISADGQRVAFAHTGSFNGITTRDSSARCGCATSERTSRPSCRTLPDRRRPPGTGPHSTPQSTATATVSPSSRRRATSCQRSPAGATSGTSISAPRPASARPSRPTPRSPAGPPGRSTAGRRPSRSPPTTAPRRSSASSTAPASAHVPRRTRHRRSPTGRTRSPSARSTPPPIATRARPRARSRSSATAPETTIQSGPGGSTSARSASFTFVATEAATFTCSLDSGAPAACTSPASYQGLKDGKHTFTVAALDAAGNADASPASRAWTVDATAPKASLAVPKQRLGTAVARGVRFSLKTNESGKYSVALVYKGRTIGAATTRVTRAGTKPLVVRLNAKGKKALRRASSASFTARLSAQDALGNTRRSSKGFKLRR